MNRILFNYLTPSLLIPGSNKSLKKRRAVRLRIIAAGAYIEKVTLLFSRSWIYVQSYSLLRG